jgi:hypothetical protein
MRHAAALRRLTAAIARGRFVEKADHCELHTLAYRGAGQGNRMKVSTQEIGSFERARLKPCPTKKQISSSRAIATKRSGPKGRASFCWIQGPKGPFSLRLAHLFHSPWAGEDGEGLSKQLLLLVHQFHAIALGGWI